MEPAILKEQIRNFIVKKFPLARTVGNSHDLLGGGIIESLGVLEVVTHLESAYGISLVDEDLVSENFQSIDCIVDFVLRRLDGKTDPLPR